MLLTLSIISVALTQCGWPFLIIEINISIVVIILLLLVHTSCCSSYIIIILLIIPSHSHTDTFITINNIPHTTQLFALPLPLQPKQTLLQQLIPLLINVINLPYLVLLYQPLHFVNIKLLYL